MCVQMMTLFLSLKTIVYTIFYKTFLKYLELFYQQHLTDGHHVLNVCAYFVFGLVKNVYVSNDTHGFTNPVGVWILYSVIYSITLVYL